MSQIKTTTVAEQQHNSLNDVGVRRLLEISHHDPFEVLGRHDDKGGALVRAFLPHAHKVRIVETNASLERVGETDLFEWRGPPDSLPTHYRLSWSDSDDTRHIAQDPYTFEPQIADLDVHLLGEGRHRHAHRFIGANPCTVDDVDGVLFSTWAPAAQRVSVVGDFNGWDGRRHMMRSRGGSGLWEIFIPDAKEGSSYKFEIRNRASGAVLLKSDPYGKRFELRPASASIVTASSDHLWHDEDWLRRRGERDWQASPMAVYEVHLGSWQKGFENARLNYREIALRLVDYVKGMGFTHVELLPITEHPLDASWGYQTTGYFAPTSRFGAPDDFRFLVDYCHLNEIGVILDWVPGHFPRDAHGLAQFDGSALYERVDPRQGEHRDWGTLSFDYGRSEVRSFLLTSALFWLEEFHLDGLRVDAVASMLYLDYSRSPGEWVPNRYGGNENLEAIDFLRELNELTHTLQPGTVTIAEESTSWPQVTRPTWLGGLGFSMKWNMGWMRDTLDYLAEDSVFRSYHHDRLTFGILYAYSENFVLPFSHDEVVHLKRSLLEKMPGDEWQRFANLRLLYTYMWTYPGKKLLFMGNEIAVRNEWRHDSELDWPLLERDEHRGVQTLVRDLNALYLDSPALHRAEFVSDGFEWIDCHDASQSVVTYLRQGGEHTLVVVLNFTPVPRHDYRIGVPRSGRYRELVNSDSSFYGGSNLGNGGSCTARPVAHMDRPYSVDLTLPPLGGLVLRADPDN